MGFFDQLAQNYGAGITQQRQTDMQDAQIEEQQQRVAMGKMQMMQAQQKQKTQKEVSEYITSTQKDDKSTIDDPAKTAKMYAQASLMETMGGNFEQAAELSNLSKGKLKESADARSEIMNKVAEAKDDLSKYAMDYVANPTPDGAKEIALKAVKAGLDPAKIPPPGTPAWSAWVTRQSTASMSAKEQRDFSEKQSEFKAKRDDAKQVHADNEADKLAQRQQTATMQAGMREDRREAREEASASRIERRQERLDDVKAKQTYDSQKQSPAQQQITDAVVVSASEAVRGFKLIGEMPAGQTTGAFTGLHDGTMLQAVQKAATTKITDRQAQMYNTATSGLSLEIGRVLTLGGGRGVNKAQLDEFKEMLTTKPGEDEYVALYKLANGVDVLRTRMQTTRDSTNPKIAAKQKEVEEYLSKVPTPSAVQAAADKAGKSTGGAALKGRMDNVLGKIGTAFSKDAETKDSDAFKTAMDKYK